jgi:anti-anti-sigma regulatory factor
MHCVESRRHAMLKVTIHEEGPCIRLVLEGRLCGPCAAEADRAWRDALSRASNHKIRIDLAGVTFVDSEGELLLMNMLRQRAAIQAGGVLMNHLIEELRQRVVRAGGSATSRRTPRPHRSPGVF